MSATGKRMGFDLVLFTSLALVCHACPHDDEPEPAAQKQAEDASADDSGAAAETEDAPGAGSVSPAADSAAAEPKQDSGPVYEYFRLAPLPKPEPGARIPVPEIKVVELGPRPQPVPGVILDAFVDENDRPRYFVTKKALFFMRPDGKVRKRIARKSETAGFMEGPPMGFSDDGSWAWQAYVDEDHVDAQHPYEWVNTDIYDPRGRLWWTIRGHLEHISPDGKRAAAMMPEGSGMVLYKKDGSKEATWEDGKRFIEPGTTMEYACPSNDGAIYISSRGGGSEIIVLDDNHEKKRVAVRIAAHCRLNACLPSVDRVLIDCSASADGVANLIMYDSEGEEIERYWFATFGNHIFSFNKENGRVLTGVSTGELLLLDLKTGSVLAVTERIEGMPDLIPMRKYRGSRKEFWDYASKFNRKIKTKQFVEHVQLFGNLIVQTRRKTQKSPKDRLFNLNIMDINNNPKRALNLLSPEPLANITNTNIVMPAIWNTHDKINIFLNGHLNSLRIDQE